MQHDCTIQICIHWIWSLTARLLSFRPVCSKTATTIIKLGRRHVVSTRHSATSGRRVMRARDVRVGRERVAWAQMQLPGNPHCFGVFNISAPMVTAVKDLDNRLHATRFVVHACSKTGAVEPREPTAVERSTSGIQPSRVLRLDGQGLLHDHCK